MVRNLWREVRLEATEQARGRPVRKFGQCAEIAGESARGLRRSPTEHCDEPRKGEQKKFSRTACVNSSRVDNHRALDVGELRRGTGTYKVRKPKAPGTGSDAPIRESPDELPQRAGEVNTVNTWKALIHVNHIEPERWGPPLVDADWYAFCQAGIEGEDR